MHTQIFHESPQIYSSLAQISVHISRFDVAHRVVDKWRGRKLDHNSRRESADSKSSDWSFKNSSNTMALLWPNCLSSCYRPLGPRGQQPTLMNVSGWPTVTGSIHEDFPWNSSLAFCPQLPAVAAGAPLPVCWPTDNMMQSTCYRTGGRWPTTRCLLSTCPPGRVSLVSPAWCGIQGWSVQAWHSDYSSSSTFNTAHPTIKLNLQKVFRLYSILQDFLGRSQMLALKKKERARGLPLPHFLPACHPHHLLWEQAMTLLLKMMWGKWDLAANLSQAICRKKQLTQRWQLSWLRTPCASSWWWTSVGSSEPIPHPDTRGWWPEQWQAELQELMLSQLFHVAGLMLPMDTDRELVVKSWVRLLLINRWLMHWLMQPCLV